MINTPQGRAEATLTEKLLPLLKNSLKKITLEETTFTITVAKSIANKIYTNLPAEFEHEGTKYTVNYQKLI